MNEADKSKITEVAHELALRTSEKGKKGKMKCLGRVSSFWIPYLKTRVLPGVGEGTGHANPSRGVLPAEGAAGVKRVFWGGWVIIPVLLSIYSFVH